MSMKRLPFWRVFAVVVICLDCSRCLAGDPLPSVDSVLAKWEQSSQKCRTLDAKLTVFSYSEFGQEISQGRFYYEAPNIGRYEIRKGGNGKVNDWSALREVLIWNAKETLWIDGSTRKCRRFSSKELLGQRDTSETFLGAIFAAIFRQLQRPQEGLPLVIDIRAAEVRERFDVTIERSDEAIWLKAIPKRTADKMLYREIGIILNAKTYLTSAIQLVDSSFKCRTVFEFTEPKVNQRPSDRDQLIAPDLSELEAGQSVRKHGVANASHTQTRSLLRLGYLLKDCD
jgi:outer membrane lipoprotein-sorting protein